MNPIAFKAIARRLMRNPAAPYHEAAVRSEVEAICKENQLDFKRDEFGNVLIRLKSTSRQRPIVLAAHMDHPGFEIVRQLTAQKWLAQFRGGVPDEFFRQGVPIRLMPGEQPAKLGSRKGKEKVFELLRSKQRGTANGGGPTPEFAVWELEDFVLRSGRIHGRACDDLVGVAAVLAAMVELRRMRAAVHVIGAITRAEEVGFHGALALAAGGGLPKKALVISLETSRELPGVQMGKGVILRVGDRASVFDSDASRYLAEVAGALKEKQPRFLFQRGLMGGGTCEATAYQEFGLQSAAVCVALGNYHNCGKRTRIEAEFVNLADACSMVDLLVAAAHSMGQYSKLVDKLRSRLKGLLREARKNL